MTARWQEGEAPGKQQLGDGKSPGLVVEVLTVSCLPSAPAVDGRWAEHFACTSHLTLKLGSYFQIMKPSLRLKKNVPEIIQMSKFWSQDLKPVLCCWQMTAICLRTVLPLSAVYCPSGIGFKPWFFHYVYGSWSNYFTVVKALQTVKCE